MNESLLLNAVSVYVINQMRSSAHPLFAKVTADNPGILRLVSAVTAALTAAGLAWQYEGGTLTITGLTLENLGRLLVSTGWSYIGQYWLFRVESAMRGIAGKPVIDRTPTQ